MPSTNPRASLSPAARPGDGNTQSMTMRASTTEGCVTGAMDYSRLSPELREHLAQHAFRRAAKHLERGDVARFHIAVNAGIEWRTKGIDPAAGKFVASAIPFKFRTSHDATTTDERP